MSTTWRGIATRVDLFRTTGARHAWRRWRRDRALAALVPARRRRLAQTLWSEAALELGVSPTDAATRVTGLTAPLNRPEATAFADDKPAAYEALARAGLPVPEHLVVSARALRPALLFLRGRTPCVVKPAVGRGGDGVTCGVRTARDLRRAALSASRFDSRLIVEREMGGDVHRFLVLDGEVVDVVRRATPCVEGDGVSSIEELMFAEYDRRLADDEAGLKPFAADLDCLLALGSAGLSLASVPRAGERVKVKSVTNFNRPEENESLGTAVPAQLKKRAVDAAAALGLRLAGVDIAGDVVLDVNATPALHHHRLVANRSRATHVAVPILRTLLD